MRENQPASFAELLKRYRQAAGLSQKNLASKARVSVRGVSDLERGARLRPHADTVRMLAKALALSRADRAAFFAAARGNAPGQTLDHERLSVPGVSLPRGSRKTHPHNVPTPVTPILDREREVSALCALLGRYDVRLVTLTGPGGVGKTRLALHVAMTMLDAFPDGVWFVRLAHLTDPRLVVAAIAQVFGLKEHSAAPIAEVLRRYLREKRLLLVIDNFEHVVAAASDVAEILSLCPEVKVLVTSRMSLGLSGESGYPVQPLPLPDPAHLPSSERILHYPGVALFVERAKAARADIEVTDMTATTIAQICSHLDGLPLAIELAASRMKLLSPPALLKRLERRLPLLSHGPRDVDERHQTMRHALAWSYDLLSPLEQRLFRRLAVFAGGGTVEAVEALCATPGHSGRSEPSDVEALDGLAALVDHSLIQRRDEGESVRVSMLHVVREYAQERLEAEGHAEACRQAHAEWYLAYAEQARQGIRDDPAREPYWLDRQEMERDNVRAALVWAVDHERTALAVRLAVALGRYWPLRGSYREGLYWFERILALPVLASLLETLQEQQSPAPPIATILANLGVERDQDALAIAIAIALNDGLRLAVELGVLVEHERWVHASLRISRQLGAVEEEVRARLVLAFLALELHHPRAEAVASVQEALRCASALGDPGWIGACLSNLGAFAHANGEPVAAEIYWSDALDWHRRNGGPHGIARQLTNLAQLAIEQGEFRRANALAHESLAVLRATRDPSMIAELLVVFATSLAEMGDALKGARLLGAAVAASEAVGESLSDEDAGRIVAARRHLRAALGEAQWADAFAEGTGLSLEEALAVLPSEGD